MNGINNGLYDGLNNGLQNGLYLGNDNGLKDGLNSSDIENKKYIVKNGLVFNYDAGNRTSYIGRGTTVRDISEQNKTGTLSGNNLPSFINKNFGYFYFNGDNTIPLSSYIDYSNILNFERTDIFSAGVWFNVTNNINGALAQKTEATTLRGWYFGYNNTGNIALVLRNNITGLIDFAVTADTTISLNKWYYAAFTYNGNSSATGVNFYINSILSKKTIVRDGLNATILNSGSMTIGARTSTGGTAMFNGNIALCHIYKNKILTEAEILQNYNATRTRFGL